MLIRGEPWNSSPERWKIERFGRCVMRTLVMQRIIRSLGLGMEGIAAQVYIFFHFGSIPCRHAITIVFFKKKLKKKVKARNPISARDRRTKGRAIAYLRYASERRHAVARVHLQRLTQGPERQARDAARRRLSASRMVGLMCGATASSAHGTTLQCSSKQAIFKYLLCLCYRRKKYSTKHKSVIKY